MNVRPLFGRRPSLSCVNRRAHSPVLARAAAAVLGASLVHLGGTPAFAADASDKAAAEALFQQGKTLMAQQDYQQACEKFRGSQELDAGLGTLLHLADCFEKLGRTASAWATFEEAASVAASRGDTNRNEIASARAAALKPKLSYIVIVAGTPLPDAAVVYREGRPVPSAVWGVPLPVDPGKLTVSVSAPGYETASVDVIIPVQAPTPIEVTLPALTIGGEGAPSAPAAESSSSSVSTPADSMGSALIESPPATADSGGPEQATWGLILGGVGIAALGVSAVFTLTGYSAYDDSLDNCDGANENACGPAGTAARRDAISDLDVATIFGAAGAVVLGAGVVLYATAPSAPNVEQAWSTRGFGVGYRGAW